MIYVLLVIIVLLIAGIGFITADFRKAKRAHQQRIAELDFVIATLLAEGENRVGQLQLSDDLRSRLNLAREIIDKEILATQYDLIEILTRNKLVE